MIQIRLHLDEVNKEGDVDIKHQFIYHISYWRHTFYVREGHPMNRFTFVFQSIRLSYFYLYVSPTSIYLYISTPFIHLSIPTPSIYLTILYFYYYFIDLIHLYLTKYSIQLKSPSDINNKMYPHVFKLMLLKIPLITISILTLILLLLNALNIIQVNFNLIHNNYHHHNITSLTIIQQKQLHRNLKNQNSIDGLSRIIFLSAIYVGLFIAIMYIYIKILDKKSIQIRCSSKLNQKQYEKMVKKKTEKELIELMKNQKYKKYYEDKMNKMDGSSSRSNVVYEIESSSSEEEMISCHQLATSKKLF